MPRRPNVIVFFTDQQRWDSTGAHGNPLDLTPNFDRMTREGTFFANTVTCQPVCGPARACLQTGMYATAVGCWRNGIPLPQNARTLAHCFNEAGYRTGYIGKWHLAPETTLHVTAENRGGYQDWLASNVLEFSSNAYRTVLFDNDNQPQVLPGYRVDACADAAIRYLDARQRDPFFLFLSFIEPHFQNHLDSYPAPVGYAERYRDGWVPPDLAALGGTSASHLAGYWGMIKRLDEALGRIMDALISLRLDQDTIILFTSDHGCHFKTRNGEYKRSCHEASVNIPTAAIGPGFFGGGRVAQMMNLVDLPPTLLDACGLAVPGQMQGRSAMPLLRRETTAWPEEAFIQISEAETGRAIRTQRWKYAVTVPGGGSQANAPRYEEAFLYDLAADPYELTNLVAAAAHAPVRAELRQRLLRRMAEAGETPAEIVPAIAKPSGQRTVTLAEAFDANPHRALTQLPREIQDASGQPL